MTEPMTDEQLERVTSFNHLATHDELQDMKKEIRWLREVEGNLRETSKVALSITEEKCDVLREENAKLRKVVATARAVVDSYPWDDAMGALEEALKEVDDEDANDG